MRPPAAVRGLRRLCEVSGGLLALLTKNLYSNKTILVIFKHCVQFKPAWGYLGKGTFSNLLHTRKLQNDSNHKNYLIIYGYSHF